MQHVAEKLVFSSRTEKRAVMKTAYWLDDHLKYSDSEAIRAAAERLLDVCYEASPPSRAHRRRHLPQAEILICGFLKAAQTPYSLISINRHKGRQERGALTTYKVLVERLVKPLEKIGWLSFYRGFQEAFAPGVQGKNHLQPPLLEWLEASGLDANLIVSVPPVVQVTVRHTKAEQKAGLPQFPKLDARLRLKLRPYAADMRRINHALARNHLDVLLTQEGVKVLNDRLRAKAESNLDEPVDAALFLEKKFLVQKLIGADLSLGGRLYKGWWQNIPEHYRSRVTIGGCLTHELDYRNQHIEMLYGLYAPDKRPDVEDLYAIPGLEMYGRKDLKSILFIVLNASSRRIARRAIKARVEEGEIGTEVGLNLKSILRTIQDFHAPIAHRFYTQEGPRLQRLDSKLMINVLLRVMDELGVVALPVHDSILIQHDFSIEGTRIMVEEGRRLLGVDFRIGKRDSFDWSHDELTTLEAEKEGLKGYFLREYHWNKAYPMGEGGHSILDLDLVRKMI